MTSGAQKRNRKRKRGQQARSVVEATAPVLADLIEGDDLDEGLSLNDTREAVSTEVRQSWGGNQDGRYVWTKDVVLEDDGTITAIVDVEGNGTPGPGTWSVTVTLDANGSVTGLGAPVEVQAVTSYEPVDEPVQVAEALTESTVIPLTESPRDDGTVPICFITPGWGSSGFYPADVLENAAEDRVFPAGTHMYWDHPTEADSMDRPERSLRDLAGVTVTDAAWLESGPSGPGLYADAKPFPGFVEAITEMAPYIGVSIRAGGQLSTGTAEGRTGPIVESIDEGRSIDFVTQAGRGGHVLAEGRTVAQAFADMQPSVITTDRTNFPTPPAPLHEEHTPMSTPADLTEVQGQLTEAQAIGAALVAFLEAHRAEKAEDALTIDRLTEKLRLTEARTLIVATLDADDAPDLSEAARKRVVDTVAAAKLPITEAGELDADALAAAVTEAASAEAAYLAEAGAPVRGMGAATADESAKDDVSDFFTKHYGFTEATSKDLANR